MATNTTNNQYKAKIYLTYSQGTNSYNFAFDYISKYYVKVRINNNDELTYGTHYTVTNKTVTLNSVVTLSEGDLIEIFRETPTSKTVEWYDSSILRAQDLNLFNVQLMHINEENMDKLLDSGMQEDKLDSKWDARLKPIKNLANPTKDDEAINYGFLKSTQNGYLQASQAKVDEAASKARDAMIQANRAYEQAENAKQNSANAYNEANRAYSEAERAKGYADKAKTSEDNVSTMKASVEATKTEVDNIKKAVEATKTDSVNAIKSAQAAATADVDSHKASAVTVLEGYKTEVASYRDATATSATNADNSATNAATKASQASTSATSAANSATSAANSATNAANSATSAANSAVEAKTYKDQAKAIVGGDFLTKLDASKTYATITDMNTNASNITALQASDNAKFKAVSVSNDTLTFTKGDNTTTSVTVNNVANAKNATYATTMRWYLGSFDGKTIADLRTALMSAATSIGSGNTGYVYFQAKFSDVVSGWGTTTATLTPGGYTTVRISNVSTSSSGYFHGTIYTYDVPEYTFSVLNGVWSALNRNLVQSDKQDVYVVKTFTSSDNNGCPKYLLLYDITNFMSDGINPSGFQGVITVTRTVGWQTQNVTGLLDVSIQYKGTLSEDWLHLDSSRPDVVLPVVLRNNNKYYLALRLNYSAYDLRFNGYWNGGTPLFTEVLFTSANTPPNGYEEIKKGKELTFYASTATKATQDGNGNVIADTYLKKSGDTVTGTLNVPTQDTTDNSTKVANTAFVQSVVSRLVNSAPTTLDTLNELANALGNDQNFATTVSTQIGQKADRTELSLFQKIATLGEDIIKKLALTTAITAITALETGSWFGQLLKMVLTASGVKYNIAPNGYVCLGSFFGGLIIQWVKKTGQSGWTVVNYPIAMTETYAVIPVTISNGHADRSNLYKYYPLVSTYNTASSECWLEGDSLLIVIGR